MPGSLRLFTSITSTSTKVFLNFNLGENVRASFGFAATVWEKAS